MADEIKDTLNAFKYEIFGELGNFVKMIERRMETQMATLQKEIRRELKTQIETKTMVELEKNKKEMEEKLASIVTEIKSLVEKRFDDFYKTGTVYYPATSIRSRQTAQPTESLSNINRESKFETFASFIDDIAGDQSMPSISAESFVSVIRAPTLKSVSQAGSPLPIEKVCSLVDCPQCGSESSNFDEYPTTSMRSRQTAQPTELLSNTDRETKFEVCASLIDGIAGDQSMPSVSADSFVSVIRAPRFNSVSQAGTPLLIENVCSLIDCPQCGSKGSNFDEYPTTDNVEEKDEDSEEDDKDAGAKLDKMRENL